jgi:pimeloyl-ACP methyl ester carboxylesterase
VRCFTSQASEARFWRGVQIPTTAAQSRAYERKVIELARRCGQVSGRLLDNISTEDTARDLNYLRQLVGDRTLTYVGLSYGTMIGQTYANMFPTRVRAMLLDAVVDQRAWMKSAEAGTPPMSGQPTVSSPSSWRSARVPVRHAVRSPATPRPWPSASRACSSRRAARRSRLRTRTRPVCSAIATCC